YHPRGGMNESDAKAQFGDEYPQAALLSGVRMPLCRERDFWRQFAEAGQRHVLEVSRFMDGSVSMTGAEFHAGWPEWPEGKRCDFCDHCAWLQGQPDFADMLRVILNEHDLGYTNRIALPVAGALPQEEAFARLCIALRTADSPTANLTQGIAATRHPGARAVL